MKVLFCTDGSKISYHAIHNFAHWCQNMAVDVLCVIDWSFLPDTTVIEGTEFAYQCTSSADSILDYAEKFLQENGINIVNKIKMCGSTIDSILEILDGEEYDFIVMGSHGKKGIQKWLGSVSQEIASVAKISTFISKDKNERTKVLFTVDNTELSNKIIAKSIETLNLKDKEIHLATVYEIPDYLFLEGSLDSNWMLEIERKQEKASRLLLSKIEKMFAENELTVSSKAILSGVPAQELIRYANKENIDLVVSGTRDKKYLSKFILGSVSKRVLENVKSDVLIIRC